MIHLISFTFFLVLIYVLFLKEKACIQVEDIKTKSKKHSNRNEEKLENSKFQIVVEKRKYEKKNNEIIGLQNGEINKKKENTLKKDKNNYLSNEYVSNMLDLALKEFRKNKNKDIFLQLFIKDYRLYPYLKDYYNEIGFVFTYNAKKNRLFIKWDPNKEYMTYIDYLKKSKREGFGLHGIKIAKKE